MNQSIPATPRLRTRDRGGELRVHLQYENGHARCKAIPGWTSALSITSDVARVTCERCRWYIAKGQK